MSTNYSILADYYDALVKDDQAADKWVEWIESSNPGNRLLDLACGSGEITLRLANRGYQVDGLDLSKEMIIKAREKDAENKVHFFKANMLDLDKLGEYDAILCLCDSFNYLLSDSEAKTFFRQAAAHINPGGLLMVDMHSKDRLKEFEEEFNETGTFEDGMGYQWSIQSEDDRIYQDFAFYLPDGSALQEHHIQKVFEPEFIINAAAPHFTVDSVKTDFDEDGITEGEKQFYVFRRKA